MTPGSPLTAEQLLRASEGVLASKLTSLDLHDQGVSKVQGLEGYTNLRTLDLSFNKLQRLQGLDGQGQLRELKVYENQLSSIGQGLSGLSNLQALDISGNKLKEVEGLGVLLQMRTLLLNNNQLGSLAGIGRATALQCLKADCNALQHLAGLSSCGALRELSVAHNRLSSLQGLERCCQLAELDVSGNALTSLQGLQPFAASLDLLHAGSNPLAFLPDTRLPQLTEAHLPCCSLTTLRGLPAVMPLLEYLDVADNRLPSGQEVADSLQPLSTLAELRLAGNPLAEREDAQSGQSSIAALLAQLPQVQWLDEVERRAAAESCDADSGQGSSLQYAPSVEEMESWKRKMGITSALPSFGHSASSGLPCRPGTPAQQAATGSCRPGSRPGTPAGASAPTQADRRRPRSARTGAGHRLLAQAQFEGMAAAFAADMASYREQLHALVGELRGRLQQPLREALAEAAAAAAAEEVHATAGGAAPPHSAEFPQPPVMPTLPSSSGSRRFSAAAASRNLEVGREAADAPQRTPPAAAVAAAAEKGAAAGQETPLEEKRRQLFGGESQAELQHALQLFKQAFPDDPTAADLPLPSASSAGSWSTTDPSSPAAVGGDDGKEEGRRAAAVQRAAASAAELFVNAERPGSGRTRPHSGIRFRRSSASEAVPDLAVSPAVQLPTKGSRLPESSHPEGHPPLRLPASPPSASVDCCDAVGSRQRAPITPKGRVLAAQLRDTRARAKPRAAGSLLPKTQPAP